MKFVYAGTDDFSASVLRSLVLDQDLKPSAVLTQKAKKSGRGLTIKPVPVSLCAKELGISVVEVESFGDLKCGYENLKHAELLVVCSFGLYIPEWFVSWFEKGTVNFHPSLVPKYRGAAPIQRAILNGDDVTGVSIIEVAPEMDAGDVYARIEIPVDLYDNYESLSKKLIEAGVPLLAQVIRDIESGNARKVPQSGEVIYASKISKDELVIDWRKDAITIHNQIRAFSPKPAARTSYKGKMIKILESQPLNEERCDVPGKIVRVEKEGIVTASGGGLLLVKRVQPENSKEMPAVSFANGYRIQPGDVFG